MKGPYLQTLFTGSILIIFSSFFTLNEKTAYRDLTPLKLTSKSFGMEGSPSHKVNLDHPLFILDSLDISCIDSDTIYLDVFCYAELPDYTTQITFSDTFNNNIVVVQDPIPGTSLNSSILVTIIASDSAGNGDTCFIPVTVLDITPPSASCPENLLFSVNSNCEGVAGNYLSQVSVSDNCTAAPLLSLSQMPAAGTTLYSDTVLIFTVIDASGNQSNCYTNLNLHDGNSPSITSPTSVTVYTNEICELITPDIVAFSSAIDNCSPPDSIVISQVPTAGSPLDPQLPGIMLYAQDLHGNTAPKLVYFNVFDTTPPTLICPSSDTILLGGQDSLNLTPNLFINLNHSIHFTEISQSLPSVNSLGSAAGDLNGDSQIDIFEVACCVGSKANQVYFGNGLNLTNSGQNLGSAGSADVDLGDVDGDGDLDAIVANFDQSSTLYLNNGSGYFTASGTSFPSGARGVSFGDLDGDTDLDIYFAIYDLNPYDADQVWLNDGNGNFSNSGQSIGDFKNFEVALGDIDGDGDLDALTAHTGGPSSDPRGNPIFLNDGNGNFSFFDTLPGSYTHDVLLHDFDGDSDLDAYLALNHGPNFVYFNDGLGNFTNSGQSLGDHDTYGLEAGDIDLDGDQDVFCANVKQINPHDATNRIWFNDGSGFFTDSTFNFPAINSKDANLADFDGDGDLDIFTSNGPSKVWENNLSLPDISDNCSEINEISVQLNYNTVTCSTTGTLNLEITASDYSGNQNTCNFQLVLIDNIAPIAVCKDITVSLNDQGNAILDPLNIDGGSSDECGVVNYHASKINFNCSDIGSQSVVLTVTDSQGNTDSCYAYVTIHDSIQPQINCPSSITISILDSGFINLHPNDFFNFNSQLSFTEISQSLPSNNPLGSAAGDLNGDSHIDIFEVACCVGSKANQVYFGNGLSLTNSGQNLGSAGSADVDLGDVDNDGDLDAIVANYDQSSTLYINNGSGYFTAAGTFFPSGARGVSFGDLDGDSDLDIYFAIFDLNPVDADQVWTNDGNGNFTNSGQSIGDFKNFEVALGDVDGDGDLDALTAHLSGPGSDERGNPLFLNDGNGNFTFYDTLPGSWTHDVLLHDFDGDSDLDAYLALNYGPNFVYFNDGSGNFTNSGQSLGDHDTYGLEAGDIDLDGDQDVFCANVKQINPHDPTNRIWFNDGSGYFSDSTFNFPAIASKDANLVDFDGDGDLDVFTSNGPSKIWENILSSPDVFDNCSQTDNLIYTFSPANISCADTGTLMVQVTITDLSGNTSYCTVPVEVVDTIPPQVECVDVTLELDSSGNAYLESSEVYSSSYDQCSISSFQLSDQWFDCSTMGEQVVVLTVTDDRGNSSTCSSSIYIVDTQAPVIDCIASKSASSENEICGRLFLHSLNIWDNCSDSLIIWSNYDDYDTLSVGQHNIIVIVTDQSGNTDSCSYTYNVLDNTPPIAQCQDITIALDTLGLAIISSFDLDNGSTDNCGISGYTVSDSLFDCNTLGSHSVLLVTFDLSGNTDSCHSNVTVIDDQAPVLECPSSKWAWAEEGNCGRIYSNTLNYTDNCMDSIILWSNFENGDTIPVGVNPITVLVTDQSGNTDSCTFPFTVVDLYPPEVSCKDIDIYLGYSGIAIIDALQLDSGSTDECGIFSYETDRDSFTCSDIGLNSVSLIVTDIHGNSQSCHSQVNVMDTIPPMIINCPTDLTVNTESGACHYVFTHNITANDNCFDSVLIQTNYPIGSQLSLGNYTIHASAFDNSGSIATCDFTLTVEDSEPPTIICPPSVTVECDVDISPSQIGEPMVSDNCGLHSFSFVDSANLSYPCGGSILRIFSIQDSAGNENECTQWIYLEAAELASWLILPTDLTISCDDPIPTSSGLEYSNGLSGNCLIFGSDTSSIICQNPECTILQETWDFEDPCGRGIQTHSRTIYIEDNAPPAMICPPNITLQTDTNSCNTTHYFSVNGTDNCSDSVFIQASPPSGSLFPVGSTMILMEAIDEEGNSSSCYFSVLVQDIEPPVAQCVDVTLALDSTGALQVPSNLVDAGSTDNCGISSSWLSQDVFSCADIGINHIYLFVSDSSGNVDSCISKIRINDNIKPVISCGPDIEISTGIYDCIFTGNIPLNITYSDNCNIEQIHFRYRTSNENGNNLGSWSDWMDTTEIVQLPLGFWKIEWRVKDEGNKTAKCNHLLEVLDTIPPNVVCQDIEIELDSTGEITIEATILDSMSGDNCSLASYTLDQNHFTCSDTGINLVVLTVSDSSGNMAQCTAEVIITNSYIPVATCNDITVSLDSVGFVAIDALDVAGITANSCGTQYMYVDQPYYYCSDLGSNLVQLRLIDQNGDTSFCTSTVQVNDLQAPSIDCRNFTAYLAGNGVHVEVDSVIESVFDNCSVDSIWLGQNYFECSETGPNWTTLYAYDQSGNIDSCSVKITVKDVTKPIVNCHGNDTVYTTQLHCSYTGQLTPNLSATDNCGIEYLEFRIRRSNESGGNEGIWSDWTAEADSVNLDLGFWKIQWRAVDSSNKKASCIYTIAVIDTIPPVANCRNTTVYLNTDGSAILDPAQLDSNSQESCLNVLYSVDQNTFGCSDIGFNTIILTVADSAGNSSTCQANVEVIDTITPIADCKDVSISLDQTGTASVDAVDVYAGTALPCNIQNVYLSNNDFTCGEIGFNISTLTVIDGNQDTTTCDATILVHDNLPPIAECTNVTISLDSNGLGVVNINEIGINSTDNCSIDYFELNLDTVNCSMLGIHRPWLYAYDSNGNYDSCKSKITVKDQIAPTISCNGDITLSTSNNSCDFEGILPNNISTEDNCGISQTDIRYRRSNENGGNVGNWSGWYPDTSMLSLESGFWKIQWRVKDYGNKSAKCIHYLEVIDSITPQLICNNTQVILDNSGNGNYDTIPYTYSDNCGIDTLLRSQESFDCSDLGFDTVNIIVFDNSGNSSECTFYVEVLDTSFGGTTCSPPLQQTTTAIFKEIVNPDYGHVKIYPNPFRNIITIEVTEKPDTKLNVRLLDAKGSFIKHLVSDYLINHSIEKFTIDLDDLNAGLYYLQVESATGIKHYKIIKIE